MLLQQARPLAATAQLTTQMRMFATKPKTETEGEPEAPVKKRRGRPPKNAQPVEATAP